MEQSAPAWPARAASKAGPNFVARRSDLLRSGSTLDVSQRLRAIRLPGKRRRERDARDVDGEAEGRPSPLEPQSICQRSQRSRVERSRVDRKLDDLPPWWNSLCPHVTQNRTGGRSSLNGRAVASSPEYKTRSAAVGCGIRVTRWRAPQLVRPARARGIGARSPYERDRPPARSTDRSHRGRTHAATDVDQYRTCCRPRRLLIRRRAAPSRTTRTTRSVRRW
jgi:hypothetical protein